MYPFIKESILYKILDKIFINPFINSKLKIILNKVIICFKESGLYKSFSKYINKNPYFLNSFFYKIFRKLIKFLDKIADKINHFFKKLILNSFLYKESMEIKKNSINRNFLIIALIIAALNFGYILGTIIFKNGNSLIQIGLFVLCVLFYIMGTNKNVLKESFIYKFIQLFKI